MNPRRGRPFRGAAHPEIYTRAGPAVLAAAGRAPTRASDAFPFMDNVTHALAGLLLAEATTALVARRTHAPPAPGFRRAAAVLGVVAAELPDADLLYAGPVLGMGKLGYLLHHRGHTHTIVFAVVAALVLWGATLALRRAARAPVEKWALLALAMAGTLSHIALDYTNSYGVHPFWPVENAWHYGDAVFIVEPWLWVVALPPLILAFRRKAVRLALGVALVGILGAAWRVDMVGRGVALALTIGAVGWSVAMLAARPARRVPWAIAAWLAVEASFFAASGAARAELRAAVGASTARDVVLNPAVGNPLCFRALVVQLEGEAYVVASAAVAPLPALRGVARCGGDDVGGLDGAAMSARPATRGVRWGREWRAPRAGLAALAATSCVAAAALRFIRVPAWRPAEEGGTELFDARYGAGGFADVIAPARPRDCPGPVPPWVPPRRDVLPGG